MYLKEYKNKRLFTRTSKNGVTHKYYRNVTLVLLKCDSCDMEFVRERGRMDYKRLNNNYFHVCDSCDSKRFAQKKGVERKQIWNMSASSDIPIGKL
tara:strand:+ start:4328 stop:4615 length:288 start_codon:yes stop_codon:yes gene_type:complete